MRVALETYQSEGRHLADPQQLLKNEGFYRKHTVRVCMDVVCVGGCMDVAWRAELDRMRLSFFYEYGWLNEYTFMTS